MKPYYLIVTLCLIFLSCDKNKDEDISLKYAKISIRNLTSSDIKITNYNWQGDVSFEIPQGEYGAEQVCEYYNGSHGGGYDIDDRVVLMYSFTNNTIEIGDSTLMTPSYANIGVSFVQALRSIDSNCYSEVLVKDTIKEVYTFTDETIQKLIYFYQDGFDIDIVKHE